MVPRPQERKVILALDIGYQSVKAMAASADGNNLTCQNVASIGMGTKQKKGSFTDLLSDLKDTLKRWNVRPDSVGVSLSGDSVTVRFIQVPNLTKAQLLSNIGLESTKYIPFPLKDTYFDCDVFPPAGEKNDGKGTAVIAAVKREAVADVAKMLHGLNLRAELLDVSLLCLFNAFEAFRDPTATDASYCAIIDIGSKKSHFGIVHEGIPSFARDLQVGASNITEELCKTMAMDEETAEKTKRNPDPKVLSQLTPVFQTLAGEIRSSFDFFEAEGGRPMESIYITGGGALTQGLRAYLQETLGVPVRLWSPFDGPKIILGNGAAALKAQGPMFTVCSGLVARMEKP